MNYLAHTHLSFASADLLMGNMISDFVKGKKQYDYPESIQKGIRLHRAIDQFTDTHPSTQAISRFFKSAYRLYAGAFTDIVYDYFLANDASQFDSDKSLLKFTLDSYALMESNETWMDPVFRTMFPYMKDQNWMYHYRKEEGIRKSFEGLRRRAKYITETDTAFSIFITHKKEMEPYYERFYPSVKKFAKEFILKG